LSRPAQLDPASPHPAQRRALPALLLGGVAIGCSPIFVRLSEVGPIATAFWRLALALLPLLVMYGREPAGPGSHKRPRTPREYAEVAAPGLLLAADLATWHLSLHLTSVANSTLLVNVAPIFVTLFSWLVLGQRIRSGFLIGLVVSMIGIVVLKGGPGALGGGDIKGDGLAVLAAAFYAGYILLLGRVRKTYATTIIMVWSTVSAALFTGVLTYLVEPAFLPVTIAGWAILIGLAWVSQAAGQSLITFALAWLPATLSSLTLLIQPVVASILAWLLLKEPVTGAQMAGGVIVLAGILLARRASGPGIA
jgi:drug/metabolite transporter (DMT)-like permease